MLQAGQAHALSKNVDATPLATSNAARDCRPYLPYYQLPARTRAKV